MSATTEILRAELERLFELDAMKQLSNDLLGLSPDDVGGTSGKGAFARALVEKCDAEHALPALADAIRFEIRGKSEGLAMSFAHAKEELPVGTQVGAYKISKKLGEGGIGVVYLAEKAAKNGTASHANEISKVAIKVLREGYARDRSAAKRWLTVARAASRVEDRALGRIVATGELEDGRPWVATEYLDGSSLAARIARSGAIHFNEARPIIRGLIQALETLHARGVTHGGVKLENVFVLRPSASDKMRNEPSGVLVDPGSDRLSLGQLTTSPDKSGMIGLAGTPKTLAPEQLRAGHALPSADLYAAAVVLYEALTGRPPFIGDTAMDVIAQQLTATPDAPSAHAPRGWVSRALDEIVLRALAKDPADRFASAREFRDALESIGRASIPPEARKAEELDPAEFERVKSALFDAPANEENAAALEALVDPALAWEKAASAFVEASNKAAELDAKKSLLFRAARLYEADLGKPEDSEIVYRKILELDAEDEIARVALEELKRQTGDAEGLVELLLEKSDREQAATLRAKILSEIAEIYERLLNDADNAFVAWVQALTDNPRDDRAEREI